MSQQDGDEEDLTRGNELKRSFRRRGEEAETLRGEWRGREFKRVQKLGRISCLLRVFYGHSIFAPARLWTVGVTGQSLYIYI